MKSYKYLLVFLLSFSFNSQAALPDEFLKVIPKPGREYRDNLQKLAKKSGAEGDFFKLRLAEKYIKAGKINDALKQVSRVKEPIFAFWKKILSAEVFFSKGKPREALALLKRLPPKPDFLLSYGEGMYSNLYKRGLLLKFLAKQSLNQKTSSEVAGLTANFPNNKLIKKITGEDIPTPSLTNKQKITKLHALHSSYKYKQVPGLITSSQIKSVSIPKEKKCQALYQLGNALKFGKGQRENAILALQEVDKFKCGKKFLPKALYRLGYLAPSSTSSLPDQRELYLKKLHSQFPKHRLADDALYKLYKINQKNNQSAKAQKYFKQLMAREIGDMKSNLLFELAYPHYLKKQYDKASQILSKGLNTNPSGDESYPRLLYWYARSLEKSSNKKNKAKSKKIYNKLIQEMPFAFYSILASKRTGKRITPPKVANPEGSKPEGNDSYLALVDQFNNRGQHEAANTILDFALHIFPKWLTTNTEYLTKKLIESQNYRKALDLASTYYGSGVYGPVGGPTNGEQMFSAFYPWAFKAQAQKAYQKSQLPKGAIEGIMREESLFQRTVKSHVGATGLMQLMPGTANMVRNQNPELNIGQDLSDPLNNMLLGSTYLKDMRKYFSNQMPLAIMAYNAGPGNVNKWLRKFGNLPLDEFIEKVPFSETKGYVKRVMRSMQVYGSYYNEPYFKNPDHFDFEITRTARQMPKQRKKKKRRRKR